MILLLLAFLFRDPVVLVALAAICESCCVATLFAGCFMKMSAADEGVGFLWRHCCRIDDRFYVTSRSVRRILKKGGRNLRKFEKNNNQNQHCFTQNQSDFPVQN